jgi:hypothetical protein
MTRKHVSKLVGAMLIVASGFSLASPASATNYGWYTGSAGGCSSQRYSAASSGYGYASTKQGTCPLYEAVSYLCGGGVKRATSGTTATTGLARPDYSDHNHFINNVWYGWRITHPEGC